jgi:hypothetical protein
LDSTKLKSFLSCPRSFFYEYVLGWRPEAPNLHLEFGSAWHLAMEHLILHGYEKESIVQAYTLFHDYYRRSFNPMMDETNAPKNPSNALKALVQYAIEYKDDHFTPIYTEIAGTVPMDDTHRLHFRMDSILDIGGEIRSREHKTGSTLSRQWTDQWSLSVQTFVYNHVLHCLFPREKVWGVEINGVFFQKKENKFTRVPARRNIGMMKVSYWNALYQMLAIEQNMNLLLNECKEGDEVMMCFPLNPESCTKYFGCIYHDFCMAWANPLQNCHEIPFGFKVDHWNPADRSEAKHVFDLKEVDTDATT